MGNAAKGILFDARPGSKVALDDLHVLSPQKIKLVSFDFEQSPFANGKDIIGALGWESSQMNIAGGKSFVSSSECSAVLQNSLAKLENARSDVRKAAGGHLGAQLELEAAKVELKSVEARIRADEEKFAAKDQQRINNVILEASTLEKNAAVLRADADLAKAEILLQEAKVKIPPTVAKDLDALSKKLATAKAKLEKAQAIRVRFKNGRRNTLCFRLCSLKKAPVEGKPLRYGSPIAVTLLPHELQSTTSGPGIFIIHW